MIRASKTIPDTLMNEDDKAHVEWLAARHDIDFLDFPSASLLACTKGEEGFAMCPTSYSCRCNPEGTNIELHGLYLHKAEAETPEQAYFIALHELGHSVLRHHDYIGLDRERDVSAEIEAWGWAVSHANYFPSDETVTGTILPSLSTYTDNTEALNRPDSLLAMCTPEFWNHRHIKNLHLIARANAAYENGEKEFEIGGVTVPMPFGKMLADWVETNRDSNEENIVESIEMLINQFEKSDNPKLRERAVTGRKLFDDIMEAKKVFGNLGDMDEATFEAKRHEWEAMKKAA